MKRLLLAAIVLGAPLIAPAAAAGGGGCHGQIDRDATGVSVALTEFCFDPLVVRVQPGQTVTWTNKDDVQHNVVGAAYKWGLMENDLSLGDSASFSFSRPGTFPYVCMFHPGMVGAVVVGNGVRAAGEDSAAGIRQVAFKNAKPSPAATAAAPEPIEISTQTAAAIAPAAPAPPADGSGTTPLSSVSSDRGPMVAAALAVAGAILVGAVVMLARRTPSARELVG
jgi:plastocyanin